MSNWITTSDRRFGRRAFINSSHREGVCIFVLLSYAAGHLIAGWKCHRKLLVAPCRWDAIRLGNENADIAAIRAVN